MWNIIIGVLLIVAGLSGRFALICTGSSKALAAVGAAILIWASSKSLGAAERRRSVCHQAMGSARTRLRRAMLRTAPVP